MPSTSFKILPLNYLKDFGEFESWAQGANSAPDGWIAASSPYLKQETSLFKFGASAALVGGSNGVGGIYCTVPSGSSFNGRTFKLGVWGRSASTGPYIELNDGVTSKTVHLDGLNAYSFLTTPAMKLDYNATQIRVNLFASLASSAYFDSAVLCEGEDLFLSLSDNNVAVSKWQPSLNMKQDQYEISQREGSFIPDNHIQGKNVRLSGTVVGSDVISARTNFDVVMKSMLDLQTTQMRHLYLYDDRVLDVFLKSFDWNYKDNLMFIEFNAQFSAQDATTRAIAKLRSRSITSGTGLEFSLVYNGNAQSLPVISFIANQGAEITTCNLKNLTTGETMTYFGTVPQNVALDIDSTAGTVFNSSVNKISDYQTSDFIKLVRGTNYFRYQGTPCQINIDYFERYL